MRPKHALVLPIILVGSLLPQACSSATGYGDDGGGGGVSLTSIEVSAAAQTLAPDDSVDASATGHYSNNTTKDLTDSVTWASNNAAAVTVSNSDGTRGRIKAVASGTATVSASYGGKSGTVSITAAEVSALTITPGSPSVDSNSTLQLQANATLSALGNLDVTEKAEWSSSDESVVTVSNDEGTRGLAAGVGSGTATIMATWKGANGQAAATVIAISSIDIAGGVGESADGYFPIGGTKSLQAIANFSDGTAKEITDSASWTSSTTSITVGNTIGTRGQLARVGEDSAFVTVSYHGADKTILLRKGCVALAEDLSFDYNNGGIGVADLHLDANSVVWFDYDPFQPGTGGAFRSVSKTGGIVTTIKTGLPYMGQWDMDADFIYWMWVDTQADQTYRIVRMSRANGNVDTLFSSGGLGGGARGLQVDGTYIYYAPGDAGGIRRMPKTGGAATAFFAGSTFFPRYMSLDGGTVYGVDWDENTPRARSVPTDGSAMDTLALARKSQFSAISGNYLYWAEHEPPNSAIVRVPLAGGARQNVVQLDVINGFTIADGHAYYSQSSNDASGIWRVPVGGGTPTLVTDACGYAFETPVAAERLASDATYVYFSDTGGGAGHSRIMRVRR